MRGLLGDVAGLLCKAAHSERAKALAAAEILSLSAEYIVAEQRYCDLNKIVDNMEGEMMELGPDWRKSPLRGYKTALRQKEKADRAYNRIETRIANIRASTVQGMMAKVKCAQAYSKSEDIDDAYWGAGGCVDLMAHSIFDDLQKLTKTARTASAWRHVPGG